MTKFYGILAVALVLGLAACSEESSEQKASEPAAKTEDSAGQAAPAEPPAAQGQPAPAQAEAPAAPADDGAGAMDGAPEAAPADDGAGAMDGAPQAAVGTDEQACLQAVSTQTNNGEVVTLSVEESEANTLVMVGVGPNKAPWKCLAKNGVVAEVMSITDEGAL
jgi:uncharacterized lipoprotein